MATRMIIVVGDITTGGGVVISSSAQTDIDGKLVARINDKATCPKHKGVFPIVSGDMTFIIDGQPVARERDYLACGCQLMTVRQHRVFLDGGTSDDPTADRTMLQPAAQPQPAAIAHDSPYDLCFLVMDENTGAPFSGANYRITLASGKIFEGLTDQHGMTQAAHSDSPELATIEVQCHAEKPARSHPATSPDCCGV